MARPHIEFIQSQTVAPEQIDEGPLTGTRQRLLSVDDETGAHTALMTVPAGWSTDLAGYERPIELFGLSGRAELAGAELGPGSYSYLAPTSAARTLRSEDGCELLVMVEAPAELDDDDAAPEILDTTRMPWADRTLAAVPAGLTVKLLRRDERTHERTWLAAVVPGWTEMRAEQHPTVEEAFILRGDGLLGTRGGMRAGAYFWRPPMVEHGPMTTRSGQLVFFRTKGGDLDVSYVDVPDAQRLVDEYLAGEPYYSPAVLGKADAA